MSDFTRPTLSALVLQARGDINGRLAGADSFLRRSLVNVLATAWAGLIFLLYGFAEAMANELLPDSADLWLSRHLAIWGITPKAATFAVRQLSLAGSNGAVVPANTVLQRSDGIQFKTQVAVTFTGTAATVPAIALTAGRIGNASVGTKLSFVSPVIGVSSTATVAAGAAADGTDAETPEAARERMLTRIRNPPQGGSQSDYEQWALEVPGVSRVWVYPNWMGAGTVGITFVMDERVNIIPLSADTLAVKAYIDARRPVTATLYVFAPVPDVHNFVLSVTPDTAAVRAAVTAELRDLYARDAEPGGTLLLTRMNEAISIAPGETDHSLTTPAADQVSAPGHLPVLGTLTWV